MGIFDKLFGGGTRGANADDELVCDVCGNQGRRGDGYFLTTTQVATSEAYWSLTLSNLDASLDPKGNVLVQMIRQTADQQSAWFLCAQCESKFAFDREVARTSAIRNTQPKGTGAAPVGDVAYAAAYAWSGLFDSWPTSVQSRPEDPPADATACDFCRRRVYPDEEVSWMNESALATYEDGGGLKRRSGPSVELGGEPRWAACPACIRRAHRLMRAP